MLSFFFVQCRRFDSLPSQFQLQRPSLCIPIHDSPPIEMTRSALITGCSKGGIGDALAQEFHKKGIRVFATARNLAKIEHFKTLGIEVLQLDVLSSESIQMAVSAVRKATGGKLDFLVNNAGAGQSCLIQAALILCLAELISMQVPRYRSSTPI